jgi:hypothetical protein
LSRLDPLSLSATLQLEWKTVHHAKRVLASLDIQRVTTFCVFHSEAAERNRTTLRLIGRRETRLIPTPTRTILSDATAVVHTLGTLIEGAKYKEALKEGNLSGLISSLTSALGSSNPLGAGDSKTSYATLNRDSALRACETYISAKPSTSLTKPRAFVHVSAEDIFRPWIPANYIEMKREAELGINNLVSGHPDLRSVHIRPSQYEAAPSAP